MLVQIVATTYIYIHYLKKRKETQCWWITKLYTGKKVYSDPDLLVDFNQLRIGFNQLMNCTKILCSRDFKLHGYPILTFRF